jgi:signal transduction histidine kinase
MPDLGLNRVSTKIILLVLAAVLMVGLNGIFVNDLLEETRDELLSKAQILAASQNIDRTTQKAYEIMKGYMLTNTSVELEYMKKNMIHSFYEIEKSLNILRNENVHVYLLDMIDRVNRRGFKASQDLIHYHDFRIAADSEAEKERLKSKESFYVSILSGNQKNVERIVDYLLKDATEVFAREAERSGRIGLYSQIAFGIVILISAMVGIFVAELIINPVGKLAEVTQRIAGGDLSQRVMIDSNDELGKLGESFNNMVEQLAFSQKNMIGEIETRKLAENNLRQKTGELEKANERLKELDRMKASFLSNMSHELRTPLASIKGFTETVLREKDMDEGLRLEFLEIVRQESERLTLLINRLLNLSRVDIGKIQLRKKEIDLLAAAREVINGFKTQADMKKLILETNLPRQLATIYADPENFKEALAQLVENSIRYTDEEGRIIVSVEDLGDEVVVSVSDTGRGIPEKELPNIFEKFYKLEKPAEEVGGVGIGLALVKYIVEGHRGRIRVESEPGKGTKISFTLPRSR